jgi:di/tricarboxylate transporter
MPVELGAAAPYAALALLACSRRARASPIGYQTDTLVYNAGGYRFRDFLRLGVPMNPVVGTTTILLIPRKWPLIPS